MSEESQVLQRILKVGIKFATLLIVDLLITAQRELQSDLRCERIFNHFFQVALDAVRPMTEPQILCLLHFLSEPGNLTTCDAYFLLILIVLFAQLV